MAQVKKAAVRKAILDAAYRLFRAKGYLATGLDEVAAAAGISRANVYVYFGSKFELFYAVFEPWLQRRLAALEAEVAELGGPRAQLRRILTVIWRELPAEANGFANNLVQAVSAAPASERYSPSLLHAAEARVAAMFDRCLPPARRRAVDSHAWARLVFMAFDGFALHAHLKRGDPCDAEMIEAMCTSLLGPAARRRREAVRAKA